MGEMGIGSCVGTYTPGIGVIWEGKLHSIHIYELILYICCGKESQALKAAYFPYIPTLFPHFLPQLPTIPTNLLV